MTAHGARGGDQPLSNFVLELGFSEDFTARSMTRGPEYDAAVDWLMNKRPPNQNHWPALAIALISQAEMLLEVAGKDRMEDVFSEYPPEATIEGVRAVNTLNFQYGAKKFVRLRPLYNRALDVIRARMLRNHPSNAPHATQSWPAYRDYIKFVYAMSPEERKSLTEFVWSIGVVPLPEMTLAAVRERVIRPFENVLRNMPTSVPKVRGGAMLQGLSFGYLLADSPNLILESHSVNTGSSRAGMLGDVDGFRGSEPELAAEVKDLAIDELNVDAQLGPFLEDIAMAPNATAVVICRSITSSAREAIESRNVTVLTVSDLARTVAVWDLPKQEEALRGTDYYLGRIQKSQVAVEYFRAWVDKGSNSSEHLGFQVEGAVDLDWVEAAPEN